MQLKRLIVDILLSETLQQARRFGIVGIFSNLIFFLVFYVLVKVGISRYFAATFCYFFATLFSFALNKKWSFEFSGQWRKSFIRYTVTYMLGYVIVIMMQYYLFNFGWSANVIQFTAILVVTGFNFLVLKFFVFS